MQVETEHDEEPVTSGRAYVYFWPGGIAERAHVQLRRAGDPGGLTVIVSALTGRTRVERGRLDLAESPERQGRGSGRKGGELEGRPKAASPCSRC